MHKRALIVLVVLAMVAGTSFALEVGGSTAVGAAGNAAEQVLEVDQEIDIDIGALHLDVDGGFDYTFHDKAWDYTLGAKYTLGILTVGGSLAGEKDLLLGDMKAFADIVVGPVGADVDFLFSADEAKEVFQGAEFSGFWNPGPLELRLGYMLKSGAVDANTVEALADGGFFGKAKISY